MKIISFIKQVLAVALGCFLFLLSLLLIAFFAFSQLTTTSYTQYEVKENSVLELNIEGQIVESVPVSLLGSNNSMIDLKVVKRAIQEAATDHRISAIYLKLSYLQVGWAVLEEIREALLAFKKRGKTIVAYGDCYSQKTYYLASVADEILINPSGFLDFKGLSATIGFYAKLFENISIDPIIFRVGDFKSAVEPYYLNKMSEESKKQTEEFISLLYDHFLTNIGLSRNIEVAELKRLAHDLAAILPSDALNATLITGIDYETEVKRKLIEQYEKTADALSSSFVNYKQYAPKNKSDLANKIAVIVAEGEIIDGATISGYVGSHDLIKTIKAVQKDPTIKAAVLRINSPGGSVLASDIIWKAIEDLKVSKPVVASMSSTAASGGYYIAAPCHYIMAHPTTITGSIGIFCLLFDPTKLMHKIGIERDVVKTAPSADFLNPRTTCLPAESKLMHTMLQASYDNFLSKVSQGRKLDLEQVKKLASGRVYTGTVAQRNGLVDELGGLEAAIEKAAALATLTDPYDVCYFPYPKTKWKELMRYFRNNIKAEVYATLAKEYPVLNDLPIIHRPQGLQAVLPYTIDIN